MGLNALYAMVGACCADGMVCLSRKVCHKILHTAGNPFLMHHILTHVSLVFYVLQFKCLYIIESHVLHFAPQIPINTLDVQAVVGAGSQLERLYYVHKEDDRTLGLYSVAMLAGGLNAPKGKKTVVKFGQVCSSYGRALYGANSNLVVKVSFAVMVRSKRKNL